MKIAILGPVTKDYIKVDEETKIQIGSPAYYMGRALKALDVEVTVYITYNKKDENWIVKNFQGVKIRHIPDKNTLEVHSEFSSNNPDKRISKIGVFAAGFIEPTSKLISELEKFDWVLFGPLLHSNMPYELVLRLKHKKLVYGNFGMFTAYENGKWVWKYREKVIKILPYLKYLFLDNNEAFYVSGQKTLQKTADFFKKKGLKNLIITEGSKGSHVFAGDKYYKIPAFVPKKLVDPTGAGDTYEAAFIRSTEFFDEPEKQGKFAAMVATMSLEKRGAFDSCVKEVYKRLEI